MKQTFQTYQTNSDEPFISRSECAKYLGVNLVTLWRYTRAGKLPCYRVGKKILFRRSEILEAIKVK